MMKYETYKPSEIDWIGNVPKHWEVIRIKDAFHQISKTGSDIGIDNYIPLENIESQTGKLLQRVSNENNEVTNLFKSGDILVNKLRPYLAKVYLPEFDGGVSGEVIVFRVSKVKQKKISSKFYFYRFLSSQFIGKINSITDGVKMPRTNPTKINCLDIAVPPLSEQTTIAQYLDTKTQTIDKKINLLTKKADYYKELRKSIINDAVCKGLDKNVKLKESGIDWIGKIPEHWEVKRVKAFAKTVKGRNLEFFDKPFEKALPNLSLDYLRNDKVEFINYCYSSDKSQLVDEDDLIIVWDGAGVGEILKGKKGFISSTTAKFVFHKSMFSKFFFHLRDSIEYTLKQIPTGMGIPHLNPQVLNNFTCPIPPLKEQTAIANYLDEKTKKIDAIVSNIEKQIDTLKELRKTLINDVVTGKIKVIA